MQSTTNAKPVILTISKKRRILSRVSLSIGATLIFIQVFVASAFIAGVPELPAQPISLAIFAVILLLAIAGLLFGFWIRGFILWTRTLGTILKWIGFFYGLIGAVVWMISLISPSQEPIQSTDPFRAMFFLGISLLITGVFVRRSARRHTSTISPTEQPPSPLTDLPYVNYLDYQRILARRVGAALIDYNVFLGICFIQLFLLGSRENTWTYSGNGFQFFIMLVLWFVYFPIAEAVWGATLGKRLLRLRVFKEDPDDPSLKVAFERHVCDFFDFFFFGVVAIILAIVTKDHKRLGDFLARTRVGLIDARHVVA